MPCPADADLMSFARGEGEATAREAIEEHLDECETCRGGVADAVRTTGARAPLAPGDELRGITVGRYVIGERVGAGGMGVVYRAEDTQLERPVVIKLLRPGLEQSRLEREARAMAKLSHPHVVQVYDLGELDGSVYVAMEYVDGGDLRAWLAGPHSRAQILDTFLQAGRGLAAAHAIGIVHRDFKPANVVIGSNGRAKVTDFGLDDSIGTPAYRAPEQHGDARADQYSFCVALREALGDHKLPPAVQRGLARDPAERWPSMDALIAALERAPRHWYIVAAVAGLALVGVIAWIATRGDPAPAAPIITCPGGELASYEPARAKVDWLDAAPRGNLDHYAQVWRASYATTCQDPAPVATARRACLARRAAELELVMQRLSELPVERRGLAMSLVSTQQHLGFCASAESLLMEPAPVPADLRAPILAVHELLATGTLEDARAAAKAAARIPYAPIQGEALLAVGDREVLRGEALTVSYEHIAQLALAGNDLLVRGGALARMPDRVELASIVSQRLAGIRTVPKACAPPAGLRLHATLDGSTQGRLLGGDWTDGFVGSSVQLDGFNDGIDLGAGADIADLPALTVCAWIQPRSYPSAYPAIADKSRDTYEGGWQLYIQTDGTIGMLTPYRDWAETGHVRLGEWQHTCATWNGEAGPESIVIYHDGAALPPRDSGTNREGEDLKVLHRDSDAGHPLYLGKVNNDQYFFDGRIDDFQLYDRALTWLEVMTVYDCSFLRRAAHGS
jgi:hypothetical protein